VEIDQVGHRKLNRFSTEITENQTGWRLEWTLTFLYPWKKRGWTGEEKGSQKDEVWQ